MTDTELRIRIAQSLAEVPAAAWDACAGGIADMSGTGAIAPAVKLTHEDKSSPKLSTRGQVDNPFISHDFLSSLEASFSVGARTGWQPRHVLGGGRRWHPAGRRALLPEEPFARRICLRPRLGRGLRARRRRLLPQAAGGGAVHAGDRPSPAGPPRPAGRRGARRARRCAGRDHHDKRAVVGPRHLRDRAGMARARRARLPATQRPAVPLGECRLRHLRRFP